MRKFANSGDIEERRRTDADARQKDNERNRIQQHLAAGAVVNAELAALNIQRWREVHARRQAS